MVTKKDIRKRVLELRNSIDTGEWKAKSRLIQNQVVTHPLFLSADAIYCYVDYRNEVGTQDIIQRAWELQKKVAVPKVEGNIMNFYYISCFDDLQEGYCGIREPETLVSAKDDKVLVIMPGSAFDRQRNRIGYGKGFYDKFMDSHRNYKAIAIAFECQLIDEIQADEHDYRPDILITEGAVYDK